MDRRTFLSATAAAIGVGSTDVGSIGCKVSAMPATSIPVSGKEHPHLAPLDEMMLSFLGERPKVPGAALAVTRHGKLIYSRGFGHADLKQEIPLPPQARFRIASVTKPITSVAIMQLVERNKLALSDRVYRLLRLAEWKHPGKFDPRWKEITVLHLLQHAGGWDRDKSFDPMFVNDDVCAALGTPSPAMPREIIRYMLGKPLNFDPGSRHSYSNFGYSLLGRIIEAVSGQSYEAFVQRNVLQPVEANQTVLGKTLLANRQPHEVWYQSAGAKGKAIMGPNLGKQVPTPYGAWCLEAMDSHGGWIATAADLARFAAAFDDPDNCPLLSAKSIETMLARPEGEAGYDAKGKPKDVYYACGWTVRTVGKRGRNVWHNGRLDGTSTLMVRRLDGLNWAVLFNGSEGDPAPADAIDALVHKAIDAVKWPK